MKREFARHFVFGSCRIMLPRTKGPKRLLEQQKLHIEILSREVTVNAMCGLRPLEDVLAIIKIT